MKDYKEPDFYIPQAHLRFELDYRRTIVSCELNIVRNGSHKRPLVLDGKRLKLLSAELDGCPAEHTQYALTDEALIIEDVPDKLTLKTSVEINPEENLALEGLYKSGDILCTQNEAEGFRRITFFIDRPDVMTSFTTELIADKMLFPVMLSNGNLLEEDELPEGRHRVLWQDPFPKPAYLFAVVAGNLGLVSGTYVTGSGKKVDCRIYCDPGNEVRCGHALASLMRAMKWDEKRFGLEYDLDTYMIVAVDSFNMGAMENKGLNIFNSRYVLASPETATDDDFIAIESVIGHEYFHNWTGNRVTLRDWFQLTLKEGLTVFRDQEFTGDLHSKTVKRISDVAALRAVQFPEDSGPNAHPIRPESYMEINNFYTATVYEKGAEVHRMIHTLLGEDKFQMGMREYFRLYDGKAVTCEDFLCAMEKASGADLSQFRLWYGRAGTPVVVVSSSYSKEDRRFILSLAQSLPHRAASGDSEPLHIPIAIGLLSSEGLDIHLDASGSVTAVISLKKEREDFVFENIPEKPHLSLNRGFSAPVRIEYAQSMEELIFMFAHDSDGFARWDAGQKAALILEKQYVSKGHAEEGLIRAFADALLSVINDERLDAELRAQTALPTEEVLAQEFSEIDFDAVHYACADLKRSIGAMLSKELKELYDTLMREEAFESAGKRKLRLRVLDYLLAAGEKEYLDFAQNLYFAEKTMTGRIGVLEALIRSGEDYPEKPLADFYERWNWDLSLKTRWFAFQARAPFQGCLDRVKALGKHPAFNAENPNLVRGLIGSFAGNQFRFNEASGDGYAYLADQIIGIDKFNPTVAAGLAKSFKLYGRCGESRDKLIKEELNRILSQSGLSKNTSEIVENTLNFQR